ncbi:MAG: M14 metallopeptidase family protein, partial [Myxococcota bacterium]
MTLRTWVAWPMAWLVAGSGCAVDPSLEAGPASHRDEVVVRVPVDEPADVAALDALGDRWTEQVVDHVDLRVDRARVPAGATVLIDDLDAAVAASMASGDPGDPFADWLPLDALDAELDALADAPFARIVTLGQSVEGRPIRGLKLAVDAGAPSDDLGILVVGGQHAREWIGPSAALYVADALVTGYGVDPAITAFLDRYRVVVVPVMNPDGYVHTWTTDRFWRKNRRDNGDGSFGVDLNRNWDAAWDGVGADRDPASLNYQGPSAFSEPETRAIADWLVAHPMVGWHLDLHNSGQVALHPFGFTPLDSPDEAALAAATTDAAAAMTAVHGTDYRSGSFNEALYPAAGVAIDWSYGAAGLSSALFELRDRGQYGFLLPTDQIRPTGEEALAGLLALAGRPERPRLALAVDGPVTAGSAAEARLHRVEAGAPVELYTSTAGYGVTVLPDGLQLGLADATLAGVDVGSDRGRAGVGFTAPDAPTV